MALDLPPNFDLIQQPEAAYCFASAAARFNLPPESLLGIAMVEAGKIGTVSRNENGTDDLGVMQVNTLWLDKEASPLKSYLTFENLRMDLCTNIHAAAWILASHVKKTGGDLWRAIGMYHHPSDAVRAQNYRLKVNRNLPLAKQIISQVPDYRRFLSEFFGTNAIANHDGQRHKMDAVTHIMR